jgi:hypothetical protein
VRTRIRTATSSLTCILGVCVLFKNLRAAKLVSKFSAFTTFTRARLPSLHRTALFHTLTSYFMKTHFNVLLSYLGYSKRSLPFRLFDQNFIRIYLVFNACYMPCPSLWFILRRCRYLEGIGSGLTKIYAPFTNSGPLTFT